MGEMKATQVKPVEDPVSEASSSSQTPLGSGELPLQRIYECEQQRHNRPFLSQPLGDGQRDWSWGSAMAETRKIAAHLQQQNWAPGSRVVILSKNCAWWIMADFAIWMAGYISVPVFPSLRDEALHSLLEHCQPSGCFIGPLDKPPQLTGSNFENLHRIGFPGVAPDFVSLSWETILQAQEPMQGSPVRDPQDIATIIYTSGTTGEPKGVMLTFQALALMAKSMMPVLGDGRYSDRILSYLPLAHIAERAIVELNSLYLQLHIFFVKNQETFRTDLAQARPTIFFTVPRLLMRFQQGVYERMPQPKLDLLLRVPFLGSMARRRILKGLGLRSVRLAASGSAPLPLALLEWYRRLGLNLIEGYGMTETGITHVPLPGKIRPGFVGNASPWAETRISADGEIQIKGPMNFAGYFRNPELTAAAFTRDGFFRTGDRGEIDAEGRLRIVGRLKEEFKTSKGKYVIPAPIEQKLIATGLFESVCVLGEGMTNPFAAVVLAADKRALSLTEDGRKALQEELDRARLKINHEFERHEHLRFLAIADEPWTVDNGFLTPTLKVRRGVVEAHFAGHFAEWEDFADGVLWVGK